MTAKKLIFILIASTVLAFASQWNSRENQHLQIQQLTAIACEMVSARAQAGSTRDVHDQLYSFWHKHSPGAHVDVLVKRGEKEVGSRTSVEQKNAYIQTCQVENRPDYEISFQFEDNQILSLALIEKFAAAFIVLLSMAFALGIFIRTVRELWFGQVLREIRKSLGLDVEPITKSNILSKFLARIFLNSASSLKPTIEKLQRSLIEKHSELTEAQDLVSKLEEERLRANQFANMVTMVRHDLKGPLSALKITASGIKQLPEESATLRQTIVSIEKIVSDLDQKKNPVSVIAKEDMTLEIAEVAIQEVVDEKSGVLASHSGVKIDFEFNPNILSPLLCDPNHLRRMVANLVQNAIEASPRSSVVRVGVRHEFGHVLIEVADEGNGIASEVLSRLFERGATFGKANGSGEGLAFVKSRAESFGGSIDVVETSSSGTVFQLRLPLAATKARYQALPSDEACKQMAILDDEIEFQKFAWSEKSGHREYFSTPHVFLNWVEAVPNASDFSFLIDLHLRDVVTGLDVIRTLGRGRTSYLATSDYLNPDAIELSEGYGVAIIPKPLLFSLCEKDLG
jgi:signal transduction histidine kinase